MTDSDPDDATVDELIDQASDALTILSGGKVAGRTTVTFFPSRVLYRLFLCCCGCGLDAIPLSDKDPVVTEVKIDGDALATSAYNLHSSLDGRWNLVREADDLQPNSWPSCQSMWRPDTADDTFSVTYTYGEHIEWMIEQAALELVCDFAAEGAIQTNQIAQGATSANLGGVNVSFGDGFTLAERLERLQAGDLGPAVSRFMSVYAPGGRTHSEVWAPELEPWSDDRQAMKRGRMKKKLPPGGFPEEIRMFVRSRSGGKCEVGSSVCAGEGAHFHHRKLRRHKDNSSINCLYACQPCHTLIHHKVEMAYLIGLAGAFVG